MHRTFVAITGASSGIGEAFARKLAPGHDLILVARRADRLQQLSDNLSQTFGGRVEIIPADLTNETDVARVADRISGERHLALLINNAGFGTRGRFWDASLESQEQMHRLHVMATVRLTHSALRNMVPRDFGAIINVASVSSFVRSPGSTSYSATKSWMLAFTEGLQLDLSSIDSKVLVQALCPGYTYSEFHDAAGMERYRLAGPAFWHTAEEVVDASIAGIRRRKLIVVPGWRYRLLTAIVPRLPVNLQLAVGRLGGNSRTEARPVLAPEIQKQLDEPGR
jgi:uncharacterized protein